MGQASNGQQILPQKCAPKKPQNRLRHCPEKALTVRWSTDCKCAVTLRKFGVCWPDTRTACYSTADSGPQLGVYVDRPLSLSILDSDNLVLSMGIRVRLT